MLNIPETSLEIKKVVFNPLLIIRKFDKIDTTF